MMAGDNLKPKQLQQVVDKTMYETDLDGDDKISFQEPLPFPFQPNF